MKRYYPLIIEFFLLGKATHLKKGILANDTLKKYYDTSGGKYVVLKFESEKERDFYKNKLNNDPVIKKNSIIKID